MRKAEEKPEEKGHASPEEFLHRVLDANFSVLVWSALLVLSLLMRLWIIPLAHSDDYFQFLLPWVESYRPLSFVQALSADISNYYVPYRLFLIAVSRLSMEPYIPIALLSVLADYGIAWEIYGIVRAYTGRERTASQCFLLVLFLPYLYLNGALWKQCDAVYVFFALAAVKHLKEERPLAAFLLLSLSFSFKLQAVFFLPFFLFQWLIRRNHSLLHYLCIPAVYLAAGLPAVLSGAKASAVYGIYRSQIRDPGGLVRNLPNVYYLGLPPVSVAKVSAILFTCAALLAVTAFLHEHRGRLAEGNDLLVCAFLCFTCVMFLPGMHERYDYAVTLLFSVIAVSDQDKWLFGTALVLNLIDVMDYSYFLFKWALIEPSKLTIPFILCYTVAGAVLFARIRRAEGTAGPQQSGL